MTHPEALTLVEYIRKSGYKLNDWEKGFIGNVEIHHKVSNKQALALQGIYAKSTGGGIFEKKEYI